MSRNEPVILGARASALSQVQARLVGDAILREFPGIEMRYAFLPSAGDRDLSAPLPALLRRGGFTGDLERALEDESVDMAVHSWKDLPLAEAQGSCVAATLPRADVRDLLLVRRDWLRAGQHEELRVLSSSARRKANLTGFLQWALSVRPECVSFVAVRGDIEQRLRQLTSGDCGALVIAKAAVDRLLAADRPEFQAARARVRAVLDVCEATVLPLALNPAAPGQGALAIEVRRNRADLLDMLAAVNHEPSFRRVSAERAQLARAGDEDHPLGVSIIPLHCGEVEFVRGERAGEWVQGADLRRNDSPLPAAQRREAVWTGEAAGSEPFRRIPLPVRHDALADRRLGLFVARADALPDDYTPVPGQVVWTAGIDTWRKLAARGVWVHGSDESLGETGGAAIRALFPRIERWVKLSHAAGFDSPHSERIATYRLERCGPLADIRRHTHFFWRSGSQFLEYLRANPRLREGWHGCGPGNTFTMIRSVLGGERVRAFLSADRFQSEVAGWQSAPAVL